MSISTNKQQGMNMVELMVAMTIGMLITLAITALFMGSQRSNQENEDIARMQENARFALDMITQDLRHAGLLGNVPEPIEVNVSNAPAETACGGGEYTFFSGGNYRILTYGNQTSAVGCFGADVLANSSALVVKRTDSGTVSVLDNDRVYLQTMGIGGRLEPGATLNVDDGLNWPYMLRAYYIDINNILRRVEVTGGTPVNTALAEGIDAFHIEFGIDTTGNGSPNDFYSPATGMVADAAILDNAVSATIYLLVRTTRQDPNYNDGDRSYQLGNEGLGPFGDGFHRRVFSATTELKNLRSQVRMRGL